MKCSYAFLDRGQLKLSCVISYLQDRRIIVTNGLQNVHKSLFIKCIVFYFFFLHDFHCVGVKEA